MREGEKPLPLAFMNSNSIYFVEECSGIKSKIPPNIKPPN